MPPPPPSPNDLDALRAFERRLADALTAPDPVEALTNSETPLPAPLESALRKADPDGIRITALLVAKLRFERLLNGSQQAADWFDADPAAFAAAFRIYNRDVQATESHPRGEAALFEAWQAQQP